MENIELEDAVITIDAAGTQTHIAKQIIQGGGDYVLSLKGNQSTIHDDTKAYIEKHMANDFEDIVVRTYRTKSKGMAVSMESDQRGQTKGVRPKGSGVLKDSMQRQAKVDISW